MKMKLVSALLAAAMMLSSGRILAAEADGNASEKPTGKATAKSDLQVLISKIQGRLSKLKEDERTEKEFAAEMKEFDTLLEKYKGEKTDDVAQILFMKAMLHLQVFDNAETGTKLVEQLKTDFPDTQQGKNADQILGSLKAQAESKKVQKSLAVGAKFPDFDEKDLDGKPLSVANHKGKVVLVDFWATWCGPCISELPNVLKTYEKYHSQGFEIIGISLDQDKDKLTGFIDKKGMKWAQFFDGKGWGNKLAGKYGVQSIPMTYLLDGEGKIIAKNLRGEALEEAVGKGLKK